MEDFVTEEDLSTINAILHGGERALIVPTKDGKRIFRVQQREVKQKSHNKWK